MPIISKVTELANTAFSIFFDKDREKDFKLFHIVFIIGLYFLGIFMWGKFTSWNTVPLNFHDWSDITIPRLQLMRDAVRTGQLPLHMLDRMPLHDVTDRFLSLPDVITTPQMFLFHFVDVQQFVFIDILIHYTLGAICLLLFRRRYNISLFSFTALFLLFNFNGYILSHYTVGHFTWASYFLYPAFFLLLFDFLENKQGWWWVTKMSFLLFYIMLAGGEHHYVWLLILLGGLMLVCWRRAHWIFAAGLFSGLLSAIRLLPPALVLDVYQKKQIFNFVLGYPSVAHMFTAMAWPRPPVDVPTIKFFEHDVYLSNYWEFSLYIGAIASIFVLWALFQWFKSQEPLKKELIFPALALVLLSLNSVYWLPKLSQVPLFGSERVLSRMIGVPFVLFLMIGVIILEIQLKKQKLSIIHKSLALSLLAFTFVDLWNNLKTWRFSTIAEFFGTHTIDPSKPMLANHADPQLMTILGIGLALTLITTVFLLLMSWKAKFKDSSYTS